MALLITQAPTDTWLYGKTDIIFTAFSDNVANTGFRYVYDVVIAGVTHQFLIAPNPGLVGQFNVSPVVKKYLKNRNKGFSNAERGIHSTGVGAVTLHQNELASTASVGTCKTVTINIREGWIVAGVFTEDPDLLGDETYTFIVQNAFVNGGYYAYNKVFLELDLSVRTPYTGASEFDLIETYGLNKYVSPIIPTRSTDRGCITFITDDGTYHNNGEASYKIRGVIYDSAGAPTTKDIVITGVAGQITHFGAWPSNLNNSSIGASFFKPSDFPDYRFYTIQLLSSANVAKSKQFIFFNKEYHNKKDSDTTLIGARVGFANDIGGWDYMNFDYKSEFTQKVERKRMAKVVGTYASALFEKDVTDRGLSELGMSVDRTISMTSRKLDMGDFRLVSQLLRSDNVYLVGAVDGQEYLWTDEVKPIVIETADNIEHRPLDSKARDITIIAREAHPVI